MTRRCAWCKVTIGEKEPLDDPSETHGVCKWCSEGLMAEVAAINGRKFHGAEQPENSVEFSCIPAESVV